MLIKSSGINKTRASSINLFFNYGVAIIQIINSIILIPVYLNYMTLSDYGAWIAGCAILNIFMIVDPGLSSVSSQKLSNAFANDDDNGFNIYLKSSVIFSLFFCLLILLIGLVSLSFIPDLINYEDSIRSGELPKAFSLYVYSICIVPLSSVLSSMLQALLKTFEDNAINFLSILSSPITIIISLFNDLGIVSLALGILVPNILRLLGSTILAIYYFSKYLEVSIFSLGSLRIFSLINDIKFLYLRRVSTITSENIESVISGIFLNTEIAASISIIKRLFISVQLFSISIGTSTYTSLAHKFSTSTRENLRTILDKTIYSFQLVHISGSVIILASISPILYLWLNSEMFFSYLLTLLFAINVLVNAKVNLYSSILYSAGNFKAVAYISIIEALVRISLSLILIAYFGITGLIIAGIISAILSISLQSSVISKIINQAKIAILFVTTKYESFIYLLAVVFGYFNQSYNTISGVVIQILGCTFIISALVLLSLRARALIWEVASKFIDRRDPVGK